MRHFRTTLKKFNEHVESEFVKVKPTKDESGHWYILPNELSSEFYKDLDDVNFVDSGKFDQKYGEYRTGGDLNLVQLYIKR